MMQIASTTGEPARTRVLLDRSSIRGGQIVAALVSGAQGRSVSAFGGYAFDGAAPAPFAMFAGKNAVVTGGVCSVAGVPPV